MTRLSNAEIQRLYVLIKSTPGVTRTQIISSRNRHSSMIGFHYKNNRFYLETTYSYTVPLLKLSGELEHGNKTTRGQIYIMQPKNQPLFIKELTRLYEFMN